MIYSCFNHFLQYPVKKVSAIPEYPKEKLWYKVNESNKNFNINSIQYDKKQPTIQDKLIFWDPNYYRREDRTCNGVIICKKCYKPM